MNPAVNGSDDARRAPGVKVHRVDRLAVDVARGVWAIRSESVTVYYVDTDEHALLRSTGNGSSPGPGDDRWVSLVSVYGLLNNEVGVITVGDRHRYLFDYDPTGLLQGRLTPGEW